MLTALPTHINALNSKPFLTFSDASLCPSLNGDRHELWWQLGHQRLPLWSHSTYNRFTLYGRLTVGRALSIQPSLADNAIQGKFIQTSILYPKKTICKILCFYLASRAVLHKAPARRLKFRRDKKTQRELQCPRSPLRVVHQDLEQTDRDSSIFYSIHCMN